MSKGTGESEKVIKEVLGNFRSQGFIKELEASARSAGCKIVLVKTLICLEQVYEGRNTSDVTTEQFFKSLLKTKTYTTSLVRKLVSNATYGRKALDMLTSLLMTYEILVAC